jgi:hypothetical protein
VQGNIGPPGAAAGGVADFGKGHRKHIAGGQRRCSCSLRT